MQTLKVNSDSTRLVLNDGGRFFYMADTAWDLFLGLTREETLRYLDDRRARGFNAIQAGILSYGSHWSRKNRYGHAPTIAGDPGRPDDAYFRHVDFALDQMSRRGLYAYILPIWGSAELRPEHRSAPLNPECDGQGWANAQEKARAWGRFLGRRYRTRDNMIWSLGGDTWPLVDGVDYRSIYRAMADGLTEGDGGRFLKTFHYTTGSSPQHLRDETWLDFHSVQSGHILDEKNWKILAEFRRVDPTRPVLDSELRYEDLQHRFWEGPQQPYLRDFDVRQGQYWALLSGTLGVAYGHNAIFQFYGPGKAPELNVEMTWIEALDRPGARQMTCLKRRVESLPFERLAPDPALIVSENPEDGAHVVAARAGAECALIYAPYGGSFDIDLSRLGPGRLRASWFDPRTGATRAIGPVSSSGVRRFTAPAAGRGNDYLLVLDDPLAARSPLASFVP